MISGKQRLVGKLSAKNNLNGKLNNATIKVYPQLEDLEVIPSEEEQNFKSSKYGYNNVTVKGIEIKGETLEVTPTIEAQKHTGLFDTVNVKGIETEELNITPSTENQVKEGLFNKVTVEAIAKTTNIKITDASYLFRDNARLDYLHDFLSLFENVKNINYICYSSTELKEIDFKNVDTSTINEMKQAFYNCSNLNTFSNFNASGIKDISGAFSYCRNLKDITNFKNLGKSYTEKKTNNSNYTLNLSACTNLTYESLMNLLNDIYDLNLTYDVANGGTLYTQSLVLGSKNLAKLNSSELSIATNKGWSVS